MGDFKTIQEVYKAAKVPGTVEFNGCAVVVDEPGRLSYAARKDIVPITETTIDPENYSLIQPEAERPTEFRLPLRRENDGVLRIGGGRDLLFAYTASESVCMPGWRRFEARRPEGPIPQWRLDRMLQDYSERDGFTYAAVFNRDEWEHYWAIPPFAEWVREE